MDNRLPTRKTIRLQEYDYSSVGTYFITICTKDRRCILRHRVGTRIARPQDERPELSTYGRIVDDAINSIPKAYPMLSVENYVVMPNHVHLILSIREDETGEGGRPMAVPTIATVINQLKGYVTKKIGHPIWQHRFYDHIIRGKHDFEKLSLYIDDNPGKWLEDELYSAR